MYNVLPLPIVCGFCGACAGLLGGGLNQCFPVWVGAVSGGSLGTLICLVGCLLPQPLPVAQIAQPVIVQNIYILQSDALVGAGKIETGSPLKEQMNTRTIRQNASTQQIKDERHQDAI
jgi:hypothetical protein